MHVKSDRVIHTTLRRRRRCRCRNIASSIDSRCQALVIRRSEEVVGGAADVKEPRRVDDKELSISKSGSFDDVPPILRCRIRITAA